MINRLIQKVKCVFGRHYYGTYSCHYFMRTWRTRKGSKHVRNEYQVYCKCCGKPTKWMRTKVFDKFRDEVYNESH